MTTYDPESSIKETNIDEEGLTKGRSKRFCCGLKVMAILSLIIIGVLAGLILFLVNNHYLDFLFDDQESGNKDVGMPSKPTNDPNTPSKNYTHYEKDSRLSRSFWGIDYTPIGAQMEHGCSVTQDDVIEDLKLLHQLTPRLRLYGLDCNQGYYVMNGMNLMNIDMGVILTIWVDDNSTTYERQHNAFWKLLDNFGADRITGVSIGNEALYRKEIKTDELIQRIREFKSKMKKRGYSHVPVYTTDIRSLPDMMPEEDQVLDNVHPFFAGVTVDQAPAWTWKYFKDVVIIPTINLAKRKGLTKVKPALISEVGWPSAPESRSYRAAVPSLHNLEKLLFSFVCQSNQKGVPYYWFEFKDAPWKNATFGEPREAFWGLFDKDRRLKLPRMPKCPLPAFKKGDIQVPQPSFSFS